LLTCCTLFSFAQSVIKGTVSDEKGEPLPGVTVTLVGTQTRTATTGDGKYTINISNGSANKKLEFKYLGFTPQVIDITGKTTVDVKLQSTTSTLTEVVITGYNISRDKASLGYAVQGVNPNDMTEARANNITDLLAGKVAGLQLTTSGQSTGSTRIVLRGPGSISGNNQPLWVVDGVPIDNNDSNGQVGNIDYGNNAGELNPDDIESITVLKGPNAAALYGSKAANGAILVTTKKAVKNSGIGISYNLNYMDTRVLQFAAIQEEYGEGGNGRLGGAQSDPTKTFPYPYGSAPYIAGSSGRSWGVPMMGQPYLQANGVLSTYSPQPGDAKNIFQVGNAFTHNISISNATDNSALRFSYTRLDNTDVMQNQNVIAKNSFQMNASRDFSPKFKIETRIQYIQQAVTNRTARNEDNSNPMNFYNNAVTSIPLTALIPWKDAAGNEFNVGGPSADNPYWVINENQNKDILNTVIGGITATYKLSKALSVRAQESGNLNWGNRYLFIQKGSLSNQPGQYSLFQQNNRVWDSQGFLMFNKAISAFSFTANLGAEMRSTNYYSNQAQTTSLLVHDVKSLNNNASVISSSEGYSRSQINSLFGTASIGYKSFLYVDVTGRNDWSSTLPLQNSSFFYPSVSASFVFTELWKIPQNILSFGKVRASIAKVGNDTSPYNLYNVFGTSNNSGVFNGVSYLGFETTLKNADLKPEQTTSTELGAELHFLNNRVTIDATVYKSNTVNQILTGPAPQSWGFQSQIINAGEIENKGIELTVSATPIKSKNFSWDATWNFSANRNLVVSLNPGVTSFRLNGAVTGGSYADVGYPMGNIRAEDQQYSSDGYAIINPANGLAYYTSAKPGALSTPPVLGNASPRALTSFGSNFKYKNFSLNFLVNAHIGGSLYSGTAFRYITSGASTATMGGRDEWLFSDGVLGETGNEVQKGLTTLYNLPYPAASRVKGILNVGYYPILGTNGQPVVDANGNMVADLTKPNNFYLTPQTYWQQLAGHISHNFVYDDSFVKLSQIIVSYKFPVKWLNKTIVKSASFSLVGRNVWTIFQKTPQGIDPESSAYSSNAQGLEQGGSLPYASYGFDFKISL
jgi:TonB-linked SusC/RagA family outer membrane protein